MRRVRIEYTGVGTSGVLALRALGTLIGEEYDARSGDGWMVLNTEASDSSLKVRGVTNVEERKLPM